VGQMHLFQALSLQALPEILQRVEDIRFHGSDRRPHDVGNLLMRQFMINAKHQHRPLLLGQAGDGSANLRGALALQQCFRRRLGQRVRILPFLNRFGLGSLRGEPAQAHHPAALHRTGAPGFGLDHDNFIGRLPQSNRPAPDWGTFYRRERLEPQHRRARDAGVAPASLGRQLDRLYARLDALVGPPEPPARLHGDLWGGNLMGDDRGAPCLIDPAVYGGHREIDLAMMRLFGGFGPRVFAAYAESYPLAAGHEERIALYQLYPLLVHVNLFGGSYVGAVESALETLL